jgi:REP element-mobilizing transposase RayT
MKYNPGIHNRRSIRLKDYDYSQSGAYFVTICAWDKACIFGEISADEMVLNEAGKIVLAVWDELPGHYPGIETDQFIVMPNHIHAIIMIVGAGFKPAQMVGTAQMVKSAPLMNLAQIDENDRAGCKPAPTKTVLSEIVRGFKTFSAKGINKFRNSRGLPVWQRNYYEHVIRNEADLTRIREYITNNPLKWALDEENPDCNGHS